MSTFDCDWLRFHFYFSIRRASECLYLGCFLAEQNSALILSHAHCFIDSAKLCRHFGSLSDRDFF
jgi:hypothetical protein